MAGLSAASAALGSLGLIVTVWIGVSSSAIVTVAALGVPTV